MASPSLAAFRAAYEAGRGTPGLDAPASPTSRRRSAPTSSWPPGEPNAFLLESIEGGAARSRYSIIGMAPDLVWRCRDGRRRAEPRRPRGAARLRAGSRARRWPACARSSPRAGWTCRTTCRRCWAGWSAISATTWSGRWSACRTRTGTSSACRKRCCCGPPLFAVFDNVSDELTLAAPIYPQPGVSAAAAWERAQAALAEADAALLRPLPHAVPPVALAAAAGARVQHEPGRVRGDRRPHAGVHRRRRRVPGGAEPAFLGAVRAAAVRALSRAAPGQPGAVPVLPRFRRLCRGRQLAGDPGAAARRHGDAPPARRHPPARGDARGRSGASRPNC